MTAPGWYPDGSGRQRWWDGTQWTEHVQPPATPWQPPHPAGASSCRRAPGPLLSAAVLVAGAGTVAAASMAGLPRFGASLDGPRLSAPGERTVVLDEGPWTMFERTGTSGGGTGFTFTRNGAPTFGPEQVHVSGPAPVVTRSAFGHGSTETLDRSGALYTGAVRLEVSVRGSYTFTVADTGDPSTDVILARPVSYAFRRWKSLLALVLGGLASVAGVVLLVLALRRRRQTAAGPA